MDSTRQTRMDFHSRSDLVPSHNEPARHCYLSGTKTRYGGWAVCRWLHLDAAESASHNEEFQQQGLGGFCTRGTRDDVFSRLRPRERHGAEHEPEFCNWCEPSAL